MSNVGRGADVRVSIMTNDVKQKNRRKRQRRRAQKHRRSVFAISAVVLLLTVIVSVDSMTLKAKDQAYRAQEAELEEKIEEEKARAEEIKNLDIGHMTPIDALNTLYKLQGKINNRW